MTIVNNVAWCHPFSSCRILLVERISASDQNYYIIEIAFDSLGFSRDVNQYQINATFF